MQVTKILLIEDDPTYAKVLKLRLESSNDQKIELTHASTLNEGIEQVLKHDYQMVLLDLTLPDSKGIVTFNKLKSMAIDVPVVIISGLRDEKLALEAVEGGAIDFILKGEMDGKMLLRIIQYNIARSHLQQQINTLAITDDLTKLHNRRGFLAIASHQKLVAFRNKYRFMIIVIDLDGLKGINDTFGHARGDWALRTFADCMRESFRQSDVLCRLGGDEFAIMAIDCQEDSYSIMIQRLRNTIDAYQSKYKTEYNLSFSSGASYSNLDGSLSVGDMLVAADEAMYEEKRRKKSEGDE